MGGGGDWFNPESWGSGMHVPNLPFQGKVIKKASFVEWFWFTKVTLKPLSFSRRILINLQKHLELFNTCLQVVSYLTNSKITIQPEVGMDRFHFLEKRLFYFENDEKKTKWNESFRFLITVFQKRLFLKTTLPYRLLTTNLS